MGECAKCGRQTQHLYQYYSGEIASTSKEYVAPNQERVTTRYNNLQTHSEYLCKHCSHFRAMKDGIVLAVMCLLITGYLVGSRIMRSQSVDLILLIIVGLTLLFVVFAVYCVHRYGIDKRNSDGSAATILIAEAQKTANDTKRCYFTPEEYGKLT